MLKPKQLNNSSVAAAMNQRAIQAAQSAENERCPSCNHDVFLQGVTISKVSRLVIGTPKDVIMPLPVFLCSKCGRPYGQKEEDSNGQDRETNPEG